MILFVMNCTKTLQLRIKDKHAKVPCAMAREVNQVWNHINAVSAKAARPLHGKPPFLSGYDLQKITADHSTCDGVSVGSGTVQWVCVEHATRRKQFKKSRLSWSKTQMAKSALDAGWAMLKTMWEYKSHQAGVVFEVVNESHSTQTCSCCGAIPARGPKGGAGLGIGEWICSECGTGHDRDTNAAKNILAARHRRLAAGITVFSGR